MKKDLTLLISLLGFMLLFLFAPEGQSESVKEIKTEEDLVREEMIEMSRHLGVTCTQCHHVKNFKDSAKPSFKMALEHKKLVTVLRANGMDGIGKNPEANCFMCHRGKLKPDYLEHKNH